MALEQFKREGENSGLCIMQKRNKIEPKICPRCDEEFMPPRENPKKTYCSYICANSRGPMSIESKEERSQWAKENPRGVGLDPAKYGRASTGRRNAIYLTSICRYCKKDFDHRKSEPRTFCSKECSIKACGGSGGGGRRSHRGWYKDFWCDSSYELAYIIWCLEVGHIIKRNTDYWEYQDPKRDNETHRYYPDFRVNGKLVEIKGWHTELVDLKIECVDEPIECLYLKDLTEIFSYVEKKTNLKIKDLHLLYE